MSKTENTSDPVKFEIPKVETVISREFSLDDANMVRKWLMINGNHLWVFVQKHPVSGYDILATNEFGGKLPEAVIQDLKKDLLDYKHKNKQQENLF